MISNVDDEIVPRERLMRLANIYSAWCERNALRCTPIAFEPRGSDLFTRLVLDIQGPGAEQFSNPERGIHCLLRKSDAPLRVRVDVVAQHSDGLGADVRDCPRIRGPFALMAQLQSSVQLPTTGQRINLAGESRATLAALVSDLQAAWSGLRVESPEVVRNYGEPGGLVRDPRTGATAPLRATEHGRLEDFHEAFRQSFTPLAHTS